MAGNASGMIWGASAALHEDAVVDARFGNFITQDLANYHVPVHADVPEVEAIMLDGFDPHANVLGSKGLGELGICGAGAAVANAVYNACGGPVRDTRSPSTRCCQRCCELERDESKSIRRLDRSLAPRGAVERPSLNDLQLVVERRSLHSASLQSGRRREQEVMAPIPATPAVCDSSHRQWSRHRDEDHIPRRPEGAYSPRRKNNARPKGE
jgi:hypothetical protein